MAKAAAKTARTRKKGPLTSAATTQSLPSALPDDALHRRVVIEHLYPENDAGRFPIKRTPGENVIVNADIIADGHDLLAAALLFRRKGEAAWNEVPMNLSENDRYTAAFRVDALGRYEYTVEGWIDRFGSWRQEISKKFGAGMDVASELLEGDALQVVW